MTGSLRSSARNPVAIALMGVLVLVFLLLGVGTGGRLPDILNGARTDAVVSAGAHLVTGTDFRKIFDQQKQRLEQQSGQTFAYDFLVKNGFDQNILNGIAQDEAESEMLRRAGIVPAPELIDDIIKKIPDAFDRVTGKFSETQFRQLLALQGLTVKQVTEEFRDQLAQQEFGGAVADGLQTPRAFAAIQAAAGLQNRDISYFVLSASTVPQPHPPTDAQLLAFERANAAQLTRPEMRTITLVRFSAAQLAPGIKIDQAQVEKAFNDRRATLSSAETRSLVQIPLRDPRQGPAVAQALAKGADPATVARALHVDPVVYQDKAQNEIADKQVAAAAFAMKPGEIRLVQGALGPAAVKLTGVTPAHTPTLQTESAKIEADLRLKAAQDQAYKQSEAFDQARQSGLSVVAAAQKAGAPTTTVGPFDAKGVGIDGQPLPQLNDKIAKSAFAANANEDTDIADAGSNDYFALHVDKITPPALPPLNEARAQLTRAWMVDQITTAFRAKAEGLVAQIKAGKSLDAVAASAGGHVQRMQNLELLKARDYMSMGRDFLGAAFGTKVGQPFAAGAQGGAYIGKVDAVRAADPQAAAAATNQLQGRLGQDYANDLIEAARQAAARQVHVQINRTLALQSLGLDPKLYVSTAKPKAQASQAQ